MAPCSKTICQAVHATTGTDAASTNPRRSGIFASLVADATAYSAYPPVNRAFVAPNTASPGWNCETPAPTCSTSPDTSDPSVSGSGWGRTLRPDLTSASHGPTPAAFTRSNTSPSPGAGRGTSSTTSASTSPKWCTRIACMFPQSLRRAIGDFGEERFPFSHDVCGQLRSLSVADVLRRVNSAGRNEERVAPQLNRGRVHHSHGHLLCVSHSLAAKCSAMG